LFFALPLLGLALAAGSPPDYVADAKTVARRPRNVILGIVVVLCLVVTVLQPHLTLLLVLVFGLDAADLVVSLIAVAALALLVLCGLLASTLFTGAYDAAAFGFGQGTYRAFLIAFLGAWSSCCSSRRCH
jgi:hypothetical protein